MFSTWGDVLVVGQDTVKFWGEFCPKHINAIVTKAVFVKVVHSGLEVSEFELLSHYYVHIRTNIQGKGINFLIPPSYGLNIINVVLQQRCFGIK